MLDKAVLKNPCGVLIVRQRGHAFRFEPCGAPALYIISISGDSLFAACHRHNERLRRAGVVDKES